MLSIKKLVERFNPMQIPEGLYYLAAFITALVGTYLAESVRRKNSADAAKSLVDAAMDMLVQKDNEIKAGLVDNAFLRLYIEYLLSGISMCNQKAESFITLSLESFNKKSPS